MTAYTELENNLEALKLNAIKEYLPNYLCILQVKSAEKCNDFLHSLAAHFLFYLVI